MSCAICFCDITGATGRTILGCKHEFHLKCIGTWLLGSAEASCPCCRATPGEMEALVPVGEAVESDDESDSESESDDDSLPDATPLMLAAQDGDIAELRRLLSIAAVAAIVDAADAEGDTAFLYAMVNDQIESGAILLAAGADVEHKDFRGNTALMTVIECAGTGTPTVAFLLNAGADVTTVDSLGDSPLEKAAFMNKPEVIELLLERGVGRMDSALYAAARRGHTACATILLDHGADPNGASGGETPLMGAVQSRQDMVALLLARGATLSPVDSNGWNAFLWATQNSYRSRRLGIMRLLMDATTKNRRGAATAIQAAWKGFTVRRVYRAATALLSLSLSLSV